MPRPGVMLYFDIRQPLKELLDADKGRLLDAILEYGELGVVPEFEGMLAMAWGFIKPKLDRDAEAYEKSQLQKKYAAFCKQRASSNLPKIPFDEWLNIDDIEEQRTQPGDNGCNRTQPGDNGRHPTTTTVVTPAINTKSNISISPSSSVATTAAATGAGNSPLATEDIGGTDFEELRRQKLKMLMEGNQ